MFVVLRVCIRPYLEILVPCAQTQSIQHDCFKSMHQSRLPPRPYHVRPPPQANYEKVTCSENDAAPNNQHAWWTNGGRHGVCARRCHRQHNLRGCSQCCFSARAARRRLDAVSRRNQLDMYRTQVCQLEMCRTQVCSNAGFMYYFSLDCFASRRFHQALPYHSRWTDDQATTTNTFSSTCRHQICWLSPPLSLISDTLIKVRTEGCCAVLVAPVWPAQPWYPLLQRLSTASFIFPLQKYIETSECDLSQAEALRNPKWILKLWLLNGSKA